MEAAIAAIEPENEVAIERPFVLERAGGTRIYLTAEELWQRWSDGNCQASDRVVDQRNKRQFPVYCLKVMGSKDWPQPKWDLFEATMVLTTK